MHLILVNRGYSSSTALQAQLQVACPPGEGFWRADCKRRLFFMQGGDHEEVPFPVELQPVLLDTENETEGTPVWGTAEEAAQIANLRRYQISVVEAERCEGGWAWSRTYSIGSTTPMELAAVGFGGKATIQWLMAQGHLLVASDDEVEIVDDLHNLIVETRRSGRPILAIRYDCRRYPPS